MIIELLNFTADQPSGIIRLKEQIVELLYPVRDLTNNINACTLFVPPTLDNFELLKFSIIRNIRFNTMADMPSNIIKSNGTI